MSAVEFAKGSSLPELECTLDAAALVAYAGATWDWYRTHYDAEAVAAAGLPKPVVDGQMLGALLARQAQDWAGSRARIRKMSFRFASMVFVGETVRVTGRVTSVEDGEEDMQHITIDQQVLVGGRLAVNPATTVIDMPR